MKAFGPRKLILLIFFALALSACGEFDDLLGGPTVSGTVQGEPYTLISGTAERTSRGGYILTLVDGRGYDCYSTPVGSYLTVVIDGVQGEGSFSAAGNVSFNVIEEGMSYSEPATSGSVEIDLVDESWREIGGEINAVGVESRVQGSFVVPICS